MDWTATIVAVIAGVGSGFLSALATPFVQRRAEETKARTSARRDAVTRGRELVADARTRNWGRQMIAQDVRFIALRVHLPDTVQQGYEVAPRTRYVEPDGGVQHTLLAAAIDDLERRWNLI